MWALGIVMDNDGVEDLLHSFAAHVERLRYYDLEVFAEQVLVQPFDEAPGLRPSDLGRTFLDLL